MSFHVTVNKNEESGRSSMWFVLPLLLLSLLAFFVFASTASAAETSRRITAVNYIDGAEQCDAEITNSAGVEPAFRSDMVGDLDGCLYVFPETYSCSANGIYVEDGGEIYVGSGREGDDGTFETTYRFVAHFASEEECNTFTNQIRGRCQHPIVAGSGTGDYRGVTGKFQMTDNVEEGTADLVGLLHFFGQ
ncbi:MAG: hypothetical protein H6656_18260 [Ardenticatenaceae bacterium]|nr:hypothetical protein [Ardenticatenaceae bacterium]